MKLTFWGAAGTVTGSSHLLTLDNGLKIMLDCGLYQGEDMAREELEKFACEPRELDVLILSHAHIDHSGMIPLLVKRGFTGSIYCTPATRDLAEIMLQDSAEIQEKDAEYENKHRAESGQPAVMPLYEIEDALRCMDHFRTIPYQTWKKVLPGVEVYFTDAGHMLGSASVTLRIDEGRGQLTFGFTGDVGRPNRPILRDPQAMTQVKYLISESTYGGRKHEPNTEADQRLLDIISETCVRRRSRLIIPAFSVGRTQELVYDLNKMEHEGLLPEIPIFVDSPLALDATNVFRQHPECFDAEMIQYLRKDNTPFGFRNLYYTRSVAESKALNSRKGPCVIIAGSGMMNAGRIRHHIANNIEDPDATLLVVGFCAQGTLGARLLDRPETIRIMGRELQVRARIEKISAFSAHADEDELAEFISTQRVDRLETIFLVHGEDDARMAMSERLRALGYTDVRRPMRGDTFEIT